MGATTPRPPGAHKGGARPAVAGAPERGAVRKRRRDAEAVEIYILHEKVRATAHVHAELIVAALHNRVDERERLRFDRDRGARGGRREDDRGAGDGERLAAGITRGSTAGNCLRNPREGSICTWRPGVP